MHRTLAFLSLLGVCTQSAMGCAVCFGAEGHAMTEGMNMGILVLLGFILPVLGGVAGFIGYLVWRAHHPLSLEESLS